MYSDRVSSELLKLGIEVNMHIFNSRYPHLILFVYLALQVVGRNCNFRHCDSTLPKIYHQTIEAYFIFFSYIKWVKTSKFVLWLWEKYFKRQDGTWTAMNDGMLNNICLQLHNRMKFRLLRIKKNVFICINSRHHHVITNYQSYK